MANNSKHESKVTKIITRRIRYCAARSCRYSIGTTDSISMFRYIYRTSLLGLLRLWARDGGDDAYSFYNFFNLFICRFPKDKIIARQWNLNIGIDPEIVCGGLVCSEHFRIEDFRRKDKSVLKSNTVPTIFDSFSSIATDQLNGETLQSLHPLQPSQPMQSCRQCQEHEHKIIAYERKIRSLRAQLKKNRNRNHYLQKMTSGLKRAFEELKQKQLIDEKLCQALEVLSVLSVSYYMFYSPIMFAIAAIAMIVFIFLLHFPHHPDSQEQWTSAHPVQWPWPEGEISGKSQTFLPIAPLPQPASVPIR